MKTLHLDDLQYMQILCALKHKALFHSNCAVMEGDDSYRLYLVYNNLYQKLLSNEGNNAKIN